MLHLILLFDVLAARPGVSHQAHGLANNAAACEGLKYDYDGYGKELAFIVADKFGGSSAERDVKKANVLADARITLDLMKAKGCPLPNRSPDGSPYLLEGMRCRTAQIRAESRNLETGEAIKLPDECDTTKWKPF